MWTSTFSHGSGQPAIFFDDDGNIFTDDGTLVCTWDLVFAYVSYILEQVGGDLSSSDETGT